MVMENNSKVAIYITLDKGIVTGNIRKSIENQINLLKSYVVSLNMILYKIYIDDDCSGNNGPKFLQMMKDLNHRKFSCIIIKDLTKLGRKLIKLRHYIEKIFPHIKLRVIAINDYFDSATFRDDSIMIKNSLNVNKLQNDNNINLSYNIKITMKLMNSTVIYGYKRDENKKIIIDPYSSTIVQRIFKEMEAGHTASQIASALEGEKIYTPNYYKKYSLNIPIKNPGKYGPYKWRGSTINKMSQNLKYIGYQLFIENQNLDVASIENYEQIINKNTYEPIISKELFYKVNDKSKTMKPCLGKDESKLISIIKCYQCNTNMRFTNATIKSVDSAYKCPACKLIIKSNDIHDILYKESIKVIRDIKLDPRTFLNKKTCDVIKKEEYEKLKAEKRKYDASSKELLEKHIEGVVSENNHQTLLSVVKAKLSKIDKQISRFEEQEIKNKLILNKLKRFIENINAELPNKFEIITMVVEEAKIMNAEGKYKIIIKTF